MADPDDALRSAGWCVSPGGVFGEKGAPLQTLSFGDELSHPITVISADFDCCVLPDQEAALVRATLTVTNEHVPGHDIKATLRFPLPDGAVVSGFKLQIGEDMVDAMCVTKKKAAAVAYKEKEKGRAVATTEAVQGSIWSTEVFPLPHGAQRTVVLEFRCECPALSPAAADTSRGCAWGLSLPLSFKQPVKAISAAVTVPGAGEEVSVLDNIGSGLAATTLDEGLRIAVLSTSLSKPAIRVATCPTTGERHFSALIPASVVNQQLAAPSATATAAHDQSGVKSTEVAVVWDVSGSREPGADGALLSLIDQLIASSASTGVALQLTVYTVGTELVIMVPSDDGVAVRAAVEAQMPLTYDGGTDLSLLNSLGKPDGEDGGGEGAHAPFEYCVLVTDGIDNFHRRPDMKLLAFPVYVALTQGGVHGTDSSLMQSLARLSGGVCMPLARSAELVSIATGAHEETILSSLKLGGLDDDALFDEALATVPDARIVHGRWTLLESGSARVSGCVPASLGTPSDVTIELSRGVQSTSMTLPWAANAEEVAEQPLLGRLLSVSFAVSAVVEAGSSQWDAKAATAAAERLMRQYGVASEHTTLLLLHEAVQFVDNDIECPAAHPEYIQWQKLAAEKEERRAADEAEALARVQSKLDDMICRFVTHFGSLRHWKAANEDQWGKKQSRGGGKKSRARMAPGACGGGGGGGFRGMTNGLDCDTIGDLLDGDDDGGSSDDSEGNEEMMARYGAMTMALERAEDFLGLERAAAPPPPAPAACPAPAAAPAPALETASAPAPARARRRMARRTSPTPEQEQQQQQQQKTQDDVPDADDPMDDALVRASSLDSLDRQSSNSGADASAAAVDGHAREAYLKPIRTALAASVQSGYVAFLDQKATHGSSPSFYLYSAQAFRQAGAPTSLCLKIATNVLEMSLCNAQTCRVVAYFVLSLDLLDLAVTAFQNVIVLAPEEPQSQTDLAFARFFRLRKTLGGDRQLSADAIQQAQAEMQSIIALLVFVIRKTDIPARFREIEWPCLILLSWVVDWAEWRGIAVAGSCWPEEQLPAEKYRLDSCQLDVFIWLGWDTDHTDIDLHVMEPTAEEVSYAHNRSKSTGAAVSRDFTQDTLAHAPPGKYNVRTNYYGSHQDSETTGSTSCVIWSIRHLGDFEREEAQFTSVRLEDYKGQASCFSIEIAAEEGVPSAKA